MTGKQLLDAALAQMPPESTTPEWVNTPNNRAAWEEHAEAMCRKQKHPDVDRYATFIVVVKMGA